MTVRLEAPGLTPVELDDCDAGYAVRSVEIGPPEVREVVAARPLSDGTIDRTRYAGSRSVTVDLTILERPPLFTPADWEPRQSLRFDGHGMVVSDEPFALYSPTVDLRFELAMDDWTRGLQVIASQYAPDQAAWVWAIDALGQPVFLTSADGDYFHPPGTNLLPNPGLATNATGFESVFHASTERINLLTENQASVEISPTTGFAGSGYTQALSGAQVQHGRSSLAATQTTVGPTLAFAGTGANSTPVIEGKTYTSMYAVWVPDGTWVNYFGRQFHNEAGALVGSFSWVGPTPLVAGWNFMRRTNVIPPGATRMNSTASARSSTLGGTCYFDRFGVFEGDIASAAWTPPRDATPPVNLVSEAYQSLEMPATVLSDGGNAAITNELGKADHGLRSNRVAAINTAVTGTMLIAGATPMAGLAATPGKVYTAMCSVWPENAHQIRLGHQWLKVDSSLAQATAYSPWITVSPNKWNRVSFEFAAPVDGAQVRFYTQMSNPVLASGESFWIDRVGIFAGTGVQTSEWSAPMVRSQDPSSPEGGPTGHVLLLTRERGPGHVEVRTTPVPATPGNAYATNVLGAVPPGRGVTTWVECLNAAGAVLASAEQNDVGLGAWVNLWAGSVRAPTGTTQVRLRVRGSNFAEGEYMRLDGFELVDLTLGVVPAADGERTVIRQLITATTTSAYTGPTGEGPWTPIYEGKPHGAIFPSPAPLSIGAVGVGEVSLFGIAANIYAGWFVDGDNDIVIASWDGHTLASSIGDTGFTAYGDARFADEPPVLVTPSSTETFDTRRELLDRVAPYLHPGVVSTLTYATDPLAEPRRIKVRSADWSAPWDNRWHVTTSLGFVTVGAPWALGPEREALLSPGTDQDEGRAYNLTFNRLYPAGTGVAPLQIRNRGNVPAEWQAHVYGPINGFSLINTTTNERLAFPGLNIPAGQYIVIDSATRTVLAEGDPAASRYGSIDFATSTWFRLVPGVNMLRVLSSTFAAPSQTVIHFADAYLM